MRSWIAFLLVAALAACGEKHDHDHDHDHEHEHQDQDEEHAEDHDEDAEAHQHDPQYGGYLIELGEHMAQVELVLESETGKLTAYVWDGHVSSPVRLKMMSIAVMVEGTELTLMPVADPLTGETAGDTSRFETTWEKLKGKETFTGTLGAIRIGSQTFPTADFRYEPHQG